MRSESDLRVGYLGHKSLSIAHRCVKAFDAIHCDGRAKRGNFFAIVTLVIDKHAHVRSWKLHAEPAWLQSSSSSTPEEAMSGACFKRGRKTCLTDDYELGNLCSRLRRQHCCEQCRLLRRETVASNFCPLSQRRCGGEGTRPTLSITTSTLPYHLRRIASTAGCAACTLAAAARGLECEHSWNTRCRRPRPESETRRPPFRTTP